jgi:acyl-coenzyme A thioesterase PaaI-like protein
MWPRLATLRIRLGLNFWPPFFGAGIRVRRMSANFREVVIELRAGLLNRRRGMHFGGSLFAMTDPFFALMVARNLPPGYRVWDKAAAIEYLAPGRGPVRATLQVAQHDLDMIVRMTADGDKHLHLFHADVVDAEGLVVARVEKLVYIRRQRDAA